MSEWVPFCFVGMECGHEHDLTRSDACDETMMWMMMVALNMMLWEGTCVFARERWRSNISTYIHTGKEGKSLRKG